MWIQEKNQLQLLLDPDVPPTTALQGLIDFEADFSSLLLQTVEATAIKEWPTRITMNRAGELRLTTNTQYTLRPGFRGNAPLKLTEQSKMVGRLMP